MLKIAVIPAYEPPEFFVNYAKEIFRVVDRLVVVNDGSNSDFDGIFNRINEIENATVISYKENKGKGYALRQALNYCVDNFSAEDIIVTADCDGQHIIEDVNIVCEASVKHRESLILGSRNFTGSNVPKKSLAGNTSMRVLFSALYGINIYDTQTGLRAFSVKSAEKFATVKGDRFEYEASVLIFAKRNQIPIREVSITTVYPADEKDHVSHFKAFSDSVRVTAVVLKNILAYVLSSSVSAVADILIFTLLVWVIFPNESPVYSMLATIIARILSSVINFTINCKTIFHGKVKQSIFRYYILWLCQLCCSYGIVYIFGHTIGWNLSVVKAVGDLCLALLSYQIQCRWVFKVKDTSKDFYGPLLKFVRAVARIFSRTFHCNFEKPNEAVIYVCRHLNMHGPYICLKWLPVNVHPMSLAVFFDRKTSIRQYREYTFAERVGKKPKKFSLKATIVGTFTTAALKSIKGVPVHRKDTKALLTFRTALQYLVKGESIAVWPDIDYTGDYSKESDIYNGFLFLGEMYKRKTGKSLKFIPLVIDDDRHRIIAGEPIVVDNYKSQLEEATQAVKSAINKKAN